MTIRPINDWLLVEELAPDDKIGDIILADTAKEPKRKGVVLAIGPGELDEKTGDRKAINGINLGDTILYEKYAGHSVKNLQAGHDLNMGLDDRRRFVRLPQVLAVLEGE